MKSENVRKSVCNGGPAHTVRGMLDGGQTRVLTTCTMANRTHCTGHAQWWADPRADHVYNGEPHTLYGACSMAGGPTH